MSNTLVRVATHKLCCCWLLGRSEMCLRCAGDRLQRLQGCVYIQRASVCSMDLFRSPLELPLGVNFKFFRFIPRQHNAYLCVARALTKRLSYSGTQETHLPSHNTQAAVTVLTAIHLCIQPCTRPMRQEAGQSGVPITRARSEHAHDPSGPPFASPLASSRDGHCSAYPSAS
jgi:hypothetical protein